MMRTLGEVEALLAAHDDVWFDGAQPPGAREFGCMCARTPLGRTPEDDYDAVHRAHVASEILRLLAV